MSVLSHGNIRFVPSIHQRLAFAEEVRRAVAEHRPEIIAVELPESLASLIVRGVLRLPQISSVCVPGAMPGAMQVVPIDPCDSMIEAIRLALELELVIEWIDLNEGEEAAPTVDLPDDLVMERVGLERYTETVIPFLAPRPEARRREAHMIGRLRELEGSGRRVLAVIGLAHFAALRGALLRSGEPDREEISVSPSGQGEAPAGGATLAHLSPGSIPEILREIPQFAAHRERMRGASGSGEGRPFDKLLALREMLKLAEAQYEERCRQRISVTQQKALYQFMRNLALVQGRLGPDLYNVVMSAKGTVDGDYGYEVYELARRYDFQEEESGLPVLELRDGRGRLEGREEPFDVDSRFGMPDMEKVSIRFRRRPTLEMREQWRREWGEMDMSGICSWPPEDETQERFMDFMRKRALAVLSRDRRQVVEFTTSILDGLDIRETLRNWHTGKLFVQQTPQPHGRVGAVVVIFDHEEMDSTYSWRSTLYAENNNESDISFYATPFGEEVVGPGISRTEFGGLLSIYPAAHIPDIWSFPGVGELGSCAEALLAAGILFSEDRYVAWIAPKPPSSRMKELAAEHGRHLIYLPQQGFSPTQLQKVRKFHILRGHHVRKYAADYIFED